MPVSRAFLNFKGLLLIIPALIPLLPLHASSTLLVVWLALCIFYFLKFPNNRIPFPKLILLPISMIFLFIITWPLANDSGNQSSYIERNLAWIIIPLAWWFMGINHRKDWLKLLMYFTCGYTLMIVYAHILTIVQIPNFNNIATASLTYSYRTSFENNSGLHPAYATLFSGVCILSCINSFLTEKNTETIWKSLILFIALLHFSSIIILASRMALIATLLTLLILVFSNRVFIKDGMIVLGSFLIVGILIISSTPFFSSRMSEVSNTAFHLPTPQTGNTLSIRTGIYTCAATLLKEHWLIGLTPGDLQVNLNHCYGSIDAIDLQQEEYNTHNEYLNKWLSFGIAGIGLLLAMLIIPLIKAIKNDFIIYACFLMLMAIVLISENMFSRQYGLFFFLIIYSPALIIISTKNTNQLHTNNS